MSLFTEFYYLSFCDVFRLGVTLSIKIFTQSRALRERVEVFWGCGEVSFYCSYFLGLCVDAFARK